MRVLRRTVAMVFALGLIVTTSAGLLAQERVTLSGFGGIALPVGAFGDQIGDNAGLATTGFLVGGEVVVPIRPISGLGWASRIEGASFKVDDKVIAELTGGLSSELSFDLGHYWMAIAFTGVQYTLPVMPGLDVYGVGQVGGGTYRGPDASIVYLGTNYELKSFWEALKGISAGGGATVKDRFLLDVRYFHFINPEMDGELRYMSEVEQLTGEQPVSWVQMTVGIRIF